MIAILIVIIVSNIYAFQAISPVKYYGDIKKERLKGEYQDGVAIVNDDASSYKKGNNHDVSYTPMGDMNRIPRIFIHDGNLNPLKVKYLSTKNKNTRKWTFMVYLDADNNLEDAGIGDFLEMASVGSTDDIAILVLFDRIPGYTDIYGDWSDTRVFFVTYGGTPYPGQELDVWEETNMGDPQTLVDFVSFSISNYPAEHYALILWDHGGGLSGVCWDDTNGDNLNIHEIRNALELVYQELGCKIDIMGFDACLMGMMEIAYQLRDYVDYVVFSQEVEPGDGWPYDDILSELVANPDMQPYELSILMAEKYVASYNGGSQGYYSGATQSAINVSCLTTVVFRKLDRLVGELLRNYQNYSSQIAEAVRYAESFYYTHEKDIVHFLELLREKITEPSIQQLINSTILAVERAILYGGHLGGHPNAYGLSAYFPIVYSTEYEYVLMSRHHQWDEFARKIGRLDPALWFYDINVVGIDKDHNGMYEVCRVLVDIDTSNPKNISVVVYGMYDGREYILGASRHHTIDGYGSSDIISIPLLNVSNVGAYALRFEVLDEDGRLLDDLYYYCDDDVSNVPLEIPPIARIIYPTNNTYISVPNVTIIWVYNGSTNLDHFEVYWSGSWINVGNSTEFILTNLNEGLYIFLVRTYDTVGNIMNSTLKFYVDYTPPQISITSPSNDSIVKSRQFRVRWIGQDNMAIDHYEINIDNQGWIDIGAVKSYRVSLQDGSHEIVVRIYDRAGFYTDSVTSFIVDSTPPMVEILQPSNNSLLPSTVNLVWGVHENATSIVRLELHINNTLRYIYVEQNMTDSCILGGLSIGKTYEIELIAIDLAGWQGFDRIVIHITDLQVTIESPLNGSVHNESCILIQWHCARTYANCMLYINDSPIEQFRGSYGSYNLSLIDQGTYNIKVVATDVDGSAMSYVHIIVDRSPPQIMVLYPENNTKISWGNFIVTWIVYDISYVVCVAIRLDNNSWINTTNNYYRFEDVEPGKHIIEIYARDLMGYKTTTRIIIIIKQTNDGIILLVTSIIAMLMVMTIILKSKKKKQ